MPESTPEPVLKRVVAVLTWVHDLLLSILLTFFLFLVAMMLAAWAGGGWLVVIAAGLLGAAGGAALCRRLWFRRSVPETTPPEPRAWYYPGIQDQFERLHARQQVLGFILVAALAVLGLLHIATRLHWPVPIDVPQDRLLAGALVAIVVVLPVGILNWRCPNCRRNLGGSLSIRQCPHCGVALKR